MRSIMSATFIALVAGCTIQYPPGATPGSTNRPPPHLPTRTLAECAGVVAPTASTDSTEGFWPAERFIVIPTMAVPRSMRGKTLVVRALVTGRGTLDSIQVAGATDERYRAQYVKAIQDVFTRGKFHPAVYQGCAVDTWWSYSVKLDGT